MHFAGICASFPPFFPLEGGTEIQVMDTHKSSNRAAQNRVKYNSFPIAWQRGLCRSLIIMFNLPCCEMIIKAQLDFLSYVLTFLYWPCYEFSWWGKMNTTAQAYVSVFAFQIKKGESWECDKIAFGHSYPALSLYVCN